MRRTAFFLASFAFAALAAILQTPAHAQAPAAEARAARAYQAALHDGPLALRAFLDQFPKGADLHIHLSGAIYAETFLRDAGQDQLCIDPAGLRFARNDQGDPIKEPCAPPLTPASQVTSNQALYDLLVNAFSMRSFVPTPGFSGHDQFFSTFSRYGGLSKKHIGEWVDEIASRAAAQNQQYVELMETPSFSHAAYLAAQNPLVPDFAQYRNALLAVGLRDEIFVDREDVRAAEALRKDIEHCGTPLAAPACRVQVRYIYQVLRGNSPEQVFAQTLLAFETIQASMDAHEPTWVGLNFVMPEDGFLSMRDYSLQMRILDYLRSVYPKVHISLHAGELAPGLVPPEGLRFHIRQAVELGHAERIGHGVDIMFEDDAPGLLKEMAQKHVMVEINLSSNEGILGVKGASHPFPLYRAAHVPVALSTDDEGVSRIEITGEYARAALDYHLSYADLKQLARTGMEHSFLAGESLWAAPDAFTVPAAACKAQPLGGDKPSAACKTFLDATEKAAAQWELERRFRAFEARF
jgi:adenosine deaminase